MSKMIFIPQEQSANPPGTAVWAHEILSVSKDPRDDDAVLIKVVRAGGSQATSTIEIRGYYNMDELLSVINERT
jgi:hypothetical protein